MARKEITRGKVVEVARSRLGFENLRPGQLEAIDAVLAGRDALVVQPTGSGKSAIYQIAGLLIEGSTVIVSPLIALQKDQVDSIREQNSAEAVALNSAIGASEFREALEEVGEGSIEYIFLAPEQLRKTETMETLKGAGVSLFVVDEAHCISQWGHDFRPDYLSLSAAIESLGHPVVLALTATASREVRDEIALRLGMRDPTIFVRGFDRPNIYLRVDSFEDEQEKRDALIHKVIWADKPGVVYAGTRRAAEEIVEALSGQDVKALFYHAGMKAKERDSIHELFMSGQAEVIVATNAFGMGVDKANIRFVFHYDPSESLDSYYQEIGRAGRDGEKSDAVLFYRRQNIGAQSFKTGGGNVPLHVLETVTGQVAANESGVSAKEIEQETGLSRRKVAAVVHQLEDAGALEVHTDGKLVAAQDVGLSDTAQQVLAEQEKVRERKRERLWEMQAYAESSECRRQLLLRHLGDEFSGPCGFCDNCELPGEKAAGGRDGVRREVA